MHLRCGFTSCLFEYRHISIVLCPTEVAPDFLARIQGRTLKGHLDSGRREESGPLKPFFYRTLEFASLSASRHWLSWAPWTRLRLAGCLQKAYPQVGLMLNMHCTCCGLLGYPHMVNGQTMPQWARHSSSVHQQPQIPRFCSINLFSRPAFEMETWPL